MKFSILFSFTLLLSFSLSTFSQVAINADGSLPDSSAMLDVKSTEMGFLPPRMSAAEKFRISNPAEGLIIFNTTSNALEVFNGSKWMSYTSGGVIIDPTNYQVAIGGTGDEQAFTVLQNDDGSIVAAGTTTSWGAGTNDFYVVKLNADFSLDTNFGTGGTFVVGGVDTDSPWGIAHGSDGGYVLAGNTLSFGSGYQFYVVKLTDEGILDNNFGSGGKRTIGQPHNDRGYSIQAVSGGGYIIAGFHTVPATAYLLGYVVKITNEGALDNTFGTGGSVKIGGSSNEYLRAIKETSDGGFIAVGNTQTFDAGGHDIYVVKLTGAGDLDSGFGVNGTFVIGGSGNENGYDVAQLPDDKYIVFGQSSSYGAGSSDFYVVKLTSSGSLDSSFATNGTVTIGGSDEERSFSSLITPEGDILLGGYTKSFGAGGNDMYIVKLTSAGDLDETFGTNGTLTVGGTGNDALYSMSPR